MPEFTHFAVEKLSAEQQAAGRAVFDQICDEHAIPREDRAFRSMLAEMIAKSITEGARESGGLVAGRRLAEARYPLAAASA